MSIRKKPTRIDWPKYNHLLGTMTDVKVAAIIGCTRDAVQIHRYRMGINTVGPHIPWMLYDGLLGTMTDTNLAKLIGTSLSTVQRHRCYQRIQKYEPEKQCIVCGCIFKAIGRHDTKLCSTRCKVAWARTQRLPENLQPYRNIIAALFRLRGELYQRGGYRCPKHYKKSPQSILSLRK